MDGKAFVSFLIISCLLLSEYSKADEFSFLSALIKNCDAVDEKKILFLLYTRQHEDEYVLTVDDQEALKNSTYDINKPTKVFVHGYLNDGTFGEDVKSGYLKKEDVNYIGVDWGTYAKCEPVEVFYDVIPAVAKVVAKMLRQLYDYGSKPEDITLIGFSFGSDVVAETNQDLAEQQAPFIIALDPAGLVISFLPPIQRLDTGDAKFVLVLHTNLLISSMINRLGHAEFFANGGLLQPGCGLDPSCSHKRAVDYFAESLTSETGFYGIECDNHVSYFIGLCNSNKQVIFSEDTPKDTRGKYYFRTNSEQPYARGKETPT